MGKWVMPSDAPQWLDLERWNKEQKKNNDEMNTDDSIDLCWKNIK